ncbi:MAG: glycosyltransferase [Oscillospiraceae bacterium]|nr:glycosyltransferase [Oscillospiraceae bacterium]
MANILFLINHAGKAGTERYVRTLAERAESYGMRPFFAYNEPGPLLDHMQGAGVGCHQIVMRGPFDIAAARRLAMLCEDLKIGVIHTNYLRENYIAILSKILFNRYIRVVYTNHFVTANSLPVRLANRVMTRADYRIISVCEAGAPRLVKNGNAKSKIIVIHNAVDPAAWRPGADYGAVRAGARRAYGIADDEQVFLCASRFAHDKGHRFLLDALARLAGLHGTERLRVVLAGDGPLEAEVREQARSLGLSGVVTFAGFVSDIKPLFYASDVYVNPSQHEALSFLILEALACGLPVIATDMGGNSEIVNNENGCGELVAYGDVDALCRSIQAFRMGGGALVNAKRQAALRTIEEKFSLGDMLEKTFASFY